MKWIICAALFWLGLASTFAGNDSPVGIWKTFDDKTRRPKSIVRITEQDGELSGKVLQVLESPEGPHALCRPCEGERKDQPVEGRRFCGERRRMELRGGAGKFSIRRTV